MIERCKTKAKEITAFNRNNNNTHAQIAIGFSFKSDWLGEWHEFC